MYVCICKAITDREIRGAIASGASSLADLQSKLGVATCCGRCADCARSLLGGPCRDATEQAPGDD